MPSDRSPVPGGAERDDLALTWDQWFPDRGPHTLPEPCGVTPQCPEYLTGCHPGCAWFRAWQQARETGHLPEWDPAAPRGVAFSEADRVWPRHITAAQTWIDRWIRTAPVTVVSGQHGGALLTQLLSGGAARAIRRGQPWSVRTQRWPELTVPREPVSVVVWIAPVEAVWEGLVRTTAQRLVVKTDTWDGAGIDLPVQWWEADETVTWRVAHWGTWRVLHTWTWSTEPWPLESPEHRLSRAQRGGYTSPGTGTGADESEER